MAEYGVEHHTEVRRERRLAPVVVAAVVLALIVGFALLRSDDDPVIDATPTTSSIVPPDTRPARLAVVHVVADTEGGPRPATTADGPAKAGGTTFEAIQATPIVTEGQIVVLVEGGTVLAGRPGGSFRPVGPDSPSSALVASNEPGHVWVVGPEDELVLVDLDGLDPPVAIPLGGDRALGPATFGVVTVREDGAMSWRRPSFDPVVVPAPVGRVPVDAGGGLVLVERPTRRGGVRVFEVLTVVEGALVGGFRGESDRPAALAPDGATVLVPDADGWTVRESRSLAERGALPAAPGHPVWVGGDRWALLVDGRVAVSDGTERSPPWRLRALAERSP